MALFHGGWRFDRMRADVRVRVRSIEPRVPDRTRIMNEADRRSVTGGMNLNTASSNLAMEEARRVFLAGVPYIAQRAADVVTTVLESVHRLLLEKFPILEHSVIFNTEFKAVLDGWVFSNITHTIRTRMQEEAEEVFCTTRANRPCEFERMQQFLFKSAIDIPDTRKEASSGPAGKEKEKEKEKEKDKEKEKEKEKEREREKEREKENQKDREDEALLETDVDPAVYTLPPNERRMNRAQRMLCSGRWQSGDDKYALTLNNNNHQGLKLTPSYLGTKSIHQREGVSQVRSKYFAHNSCSGSNLLCSEKDS